MPEYLTKAPSLPWLTDHDAPALEPAPWRFAREEEGLEDDDFFDDEEDDDFEDDEDDVYDDDDDDFFDDDDDDAFERFGDDDDD